MMTSRILLSSIAETEGALGRNEAPSSPKNLHLDLPFRELSFHYFLNMLLTEKILTYHIPISLSSKYANVTAHRIIKGCG